MVYKNYNILWKISLAPSQHFHFRHNRGVGVFFGPYVSPMAVLKKDCPVLRLKCLVTTSPPPTIPTLGGDGNVNKFFFLAGTYFTNSTHTFTQLSILVVQDQMALDRQTHRLGEEADINIILLKKYSELIHQLFIDDNVPGFCTSKIIPRCYSLTRLIKTSLPQGEGESLYVGVTAGNIFLWTSIITILRNLKPPGPICYVFLSQSVDNLEYPGHALYIIKC